MSMAEAQLTLARPTSRRRLALPIVVFAAFAALPLAATLTDQSFLMVLATRMMILAIAAVALDFVLGYGGLVSFGFSAFLGIGAYAVGIAAAHGLVEAAVAFPLAILAAALFGLATGAVAMRTSGVYFIMITLAFGQMAFFTAMSLSAYGGDDGLTIWRRSRLFGSRALEDPFVFYYLVFATLLAVYWLGRLAVASRFGRVLSGCRQSPMRMRAIGIDPYRYQLAAYTIAAAVGGLAGALLANHTEFVSPAMMSWHRSGELIVMVVLGGMGTLHGAVIGAAAYLALEEALSHVTEHWRMVFGPILILIVLFGRGGIAGLVQRVRGGT
jgi:branched-chain amino acid transport system permease protein